MGAKGLVDQGEAERISRSDIAMRSDCPDGSGCGKQKDLAHAREFNHVIGPFQPQSQQQERTLSAEADVLLEGASSEAEHGNTGLLQDLVSTSVFAVPDLAPSSSQGFRDPVDALM